MRCPALSGREIPDLKRRRIASWAKRRGMREREADDLEGMVVDVEITDYPTRTGRREAA